MDSKTIASGAKPLEVAIIPIVTSICSVLDRRFARSD